MSTTAAGRPACALILVDIQNDFCEGGSLGVEGGAEVASRAAAHISRHAGDYAAVVATADWHIDPGTHFSQNPDFVDSWPVHCVAGTSGAEFHPGLRAELAAVEAVFRKGEFTAAYSGFEGRAAADAAEPGATDTRQEPDGQHAPEQRQASDGLLLADWLRERGITAVDVCGIATDHCVRATVLDGCREGFAVTVLTDMIAGVDEQRSAAALREMQDAGAQLS